MQYKTRFLVLFALSLAIASLCLCVGAMASTDFSAAAFFKDNAVDAKASEPNSALEASPDEAALEEDAALALAAFDEDEAFPDEFEFDSAQAGSVTMPIRVEYNEIADAQFVDKSGKTISVKDYGFPANGDWMYQGKVTIIAQSASKVYDGTPLSRTDGILVTGLPKQFTITAKAGGSQTKAGESDNPIAGYEIYNQAKENVTNHFSSIDTVPGQLLVDPLPITVWTGSASKIYDGKALTNEKAGIDLVDGNHQQQPWRNLALTFSEKDGEALYCLCGTVWVYGINPLTGEAQQTELSAGQKLTSVYINDAIDKENITYKIEKMTQETLPDEVLGLYASNPDLMAQFCKDAKWNEAEFAKYIESRLPSDDLDDLDDLDDEDDFSDEEPFDDGFFDGEDFFDDESFDEEPLDEESFDEEPLDEESFDEEPLDEEPADEEPVVEEPADELPIEDNPLDEDPFAEGSYIIESVEVSYTEEVIYDENPIVADSSDEDSYDEYPIVDTTYDEDSDNEYPVVEGSNDDSDDEYPVVEGSFDEDSDDEYPNPEESYDQDISISHLEVIMGDTKQRILTEAVKLFAQEGYEAVTVEDIAQAVGIKAPSLYKHYKNKRDIFDHILQKMEQNDAHNAEECSVPTGTLEIMPEAYENSALEDLLAFCKVQFRYWTENEFASSFRKMLTIEQYRSEEMNVLYHQYLGSGPLHYVADLLGSEEKALELYGPMYLLYSVYDEADNKEAVFELLNQHIQQYQTQKKG
ncbi:MAG: TetR family transcriptional regulator [Coriobacteriales bacterium]|nr:TetR family transcriptional regulator [Coriobacteriales bacterium]